LRDVNFLQAITGKQKREFRQKAKDCGPVSFYESRKPVGFLKKRGLSEERFGFQALRFRKTSGPD